MAANHLAAAARELPPDGGVPDDLVARLAQTPYVLIGEATHGTAEFSALRAAQTRRLIEEHDFEAGAIEGGWPDAGRVHRFVTDTGDDDTVDDALGDVVRLPRWMWRNTVVRDFVDWLREHNAQRHQRPHRRAGQP